jgi:hypothetical protein
VDRSSKLSLPLCIPVFCLNAFSYEATEIDKKLEAEVCEGVLTRMNLPRPSFKLQERSCEVIARE